MYKDISQKRVYLQILDQIKENIINKELKAGDRLPPERQWAEQLGVSRASVREAIRSLEMFGLVRCRQGEGNFVSDNLSTALTQPLSIMYWLNDGKVEDIHAFRQALEIEAARQAARHATRSDIEELLSIQKALASEENPQLAGDLDKDFHHAIARISGNCLINDTLNSADGLMDMVIHETRIAILREEQDADVINFQHERIIEAIEAGDAILAYKRMLEHMLYVEDFINQFLVDRQNP